MLTLTLGVVMATPLPPLDWVAVNDTVMGGVSKGQVQELAEGQLRFTGTLSLESNGGFVSVRSSPQALPVTGASALRIRARGDGRTWSVNAYRSDVPLRAGSYRIPMPTQADGVTEIVVELADFEPSSFGRPVAGAPALDAHPERIDQLGFLLADKQPGSFSLEVLSIEPVGTYRPRSPGMEAVTTRLRAALAEGVPAFNRGDPQACREVYAQVLREIQEQPALTDGEQAIVHAALERATGQRASEAAWTLRGAIDTVLASR